MKDITDVYFDWLAERSNMASPFLLLSRLLHSRQFYAIVPMDQNRMQYGPELRNLFRESHPDFSEKQYEKLERNKCSLLEMLIGLSMRMEDMYKDSLFERKANDWLFEMLSNLKLSYMTDSVMHEFPEYVDSAVRIISQLLERTYLPDGTGGLFPLRKPGADQRQVDIWSQMMAYLRENYSMND